jgi:hypothetical protein
MSLPFYSKCPKCAYACPYVSHCPYLGWAASGSLVFASNGKRDAEMESVQPGLDSIVNPIDSH